MQRYPNKKTTVNVDKYNRFHTICKVSGVYAEEPAMGQTAPASQSPTKHLPSCFDRLPKGFTKELAEEIYETLLSLPKLRPEQMRGPGPFDCPVTCLGERKARYIIERVAQGRRFKILDGFERSTVKFVGSAAGAIEAVRLGAVDNIVGELFFKRIQKIASTLASPNVSTVGVTQLRAPLLERIRSHRRLGPGFPSLEKLHGCWIQVVRYHGIAAIGALRVIDIGFHPEQY